MATWYGMNMSSTLKPLSVIISSPGSHMYAGETWPFHSGHILTYKLVGQMPHQPYVAAYRAVCMRNHFLSRGCSGCGRAGWEGGRARAGEGRGRIIAARGGAHARRRGPAWGRLGRGLGSSSRIKKNTIFLLKFPEVLWPNYFIVPMFSMNCPTSKKSLKNALAEFNFHYLSVTCWPAI